MEITLSSIEEVMTVQGTSLFIGNERDTSKTSVFIEDITELKDTRLHDKVKELEMLLQTAVREFKELAIEAYNNEQMIEGALDVGVNELRSA